MPLLGLVDDVGEKREQVLGAAQERSTLLHTKEHTLMAQND